jgi:hypothetical protein
MADLANADSAKFASNIHFIYFFTNYDNKFLKYSKMAELTKKISTGAVLVHAGKTIYT